MDAASLNHIPAKKLIGEATINIDQIMKLCYMGKEVLF